MTRKQPSPHSNLDIKLEAVRQVLEDHKPVAMVANNLSLHRDTVNRWVNTYKKSGKEGLVNPRSITQSIQPQDVKQLRELEKQLREKEQEIEILKKFQAFLKENE